MDKMLHRAENPWKPSFKVRTSNVDQETLAKEKLRRSAQGILNKLTPQNFEKLLQQFKNLKVNSLEKLSIVTDLTYEKAVNEPLYSIPYANLCKHATTVGAPFGGRRITFCDLLLMKCQKEFEKEQSNDRKKVVEQEIYEKERARRYRKVGNIRFMSELFKIEVLNDLIMHECIQNLFQSGDEESLECLCKLLQIAGKQLDEGSIENSKENMDMYFIEMQKIVDKHATSTRIRFMLQDVIDLRKNNWVPRRKELCPTTISEVHKEYEQEAFQVDPACHAELKLSGSDLEENVAKTKSQSLIEEFLQNNDLKVTVESIAETFSPKTIKVFLETVINIALKESSKSRTSIGKLLLTLLDEKLIKSEEYKTGFIPIFSNMDFYKKEKPEIWEYLSEIMAPVAIHEDYGIDYLKGVFKSGLSVEDKEKLLASISHFIKKNER